MARLLSVSTSGYYAWLAREPSKRSRSDAQLLERIRTLHASSRGTYGVPRIHAQLAREGVHVGRKRVARLMRMAGLRGTSRRRWPHTTRQRAGARRAPDLVRRHFCAEATNMLWVADATYFPTGEGFPYLAVVLDLFSRRIVGWAPSNRVNLNVNCLSVLQFGRSTEDSPCHGGRQLWLLGRQGSVARATCRPRR